MSYCSISFVSSTWLGSWSSDFGGCLPIWIHENICASKFALAHHLHILSLILYPLDLITNIPIFNAILITRLHLPPWPAHQTLTPPPFTTTSYPLKLVGNSYLSTILLSISNQIGCIVFTLNLPLSSMVQRVRTVNHAMANRYVFRRALTPL